MVNYIRGEFEDSNLVGRLNVFMWIIDLDYPPFFWILQKELDGLKIMPDI